MFTRLALATLAALALLVALTFTNHPPALHLNDIHVKPVNVPVFSEAERTDVVFERRFPVRAGEMLEIALSHADVTIRTESTDEAYIRVELTGHNMSRAREFFEAQRFEAAKNGRVVSLRNDPRNWNGDSGGADIDVEIVVPEVFDAGVKVAHGDVAVDRMKGNLSFNVAHGDLETDVLSGVSLSLVVAHGDIDTGELRSEKVELRASHGDIDVALLSAADVRVTTAHGDIAIGGLSGYADLRTTHGDIDVTFTRFEGGRFSNSHGDIDIALPVASRAEVRISADDVEISGIPQFQGTIKENRADGTINGGGPRLEATTSFGHIKMRGGSEG